MGKIDRWRRRETKDVAFVEIAQVNFDELEVRERNLQFVKLLKILINEIKSIDSVFAGQEIDEITIRYDPNNLLLIAESTLVR